MIAMVQENPFAEVAEEDTYEQLERMICDLSWKRARASGLDFEECKAEANLAFVNAYRTHQPDKSKFITWAYCVIDNRLKDLARREAIYRNRFTPIDSIEMASAPAAIIEGRVLSDEAEFVLNLLLDPPQGMPTQRKRVLSWLRNHLKEVGWTLGQIINSFDEIREVLRG